MDCERGYANVRVGLTFYDVICDFNFFLSGTRRGQKTLKKKGFPIFFFFLSSVLV